ETSGFTKMGMVQFTVSEKMKASQFFGSGDLYWIRAEITGDFFNKEPLVTGTQEFSFPLPSSLLPYLEKMRPLFHKNIMRKRRNLSGLSCCPGSENCIKCP
ncbi:MAG TPA: hypothetical protein PKC27_07095, partial [Methanomethylovorans sp.]|nr:hypothetical protein [Methanomethylovorans sp.]